MQRRNIVSTAADGSSLWKKGSLLSACVNTLLCTKLSGKIHSNGARSTAYSLPSSKLCLTFNINTVIMKIVW